MPHWYIRVQDDERNEEWMVVQADNAADAMERVGVDVSHVRLIQARGRVRGWLRRWLASIGASIYCVFVFADSLGLNWMESAALLGVLTVAALGTRAHRARRRSKAGSKLPIKRHQVTQTALWLLAPTMWMMLVTAVSLGVSVVEALGGEEAIRPSDVVVPLFLFYLARLDLADLL
ncbi:MAG: hypothetical protein IH985_04285 [Planctomycetes bacterium]|nr:hypothetical protein [Planctomycetota bacterium]